jgi:hypothetical protein
MSYSTQEERDTLYATIREWMPRMDVTHRAYRVNRSIGICSDASMFLATTIWSLCEYLRGLDLAGYAGSTAVANVWDAWTEQRFVGDVDFLVAYGARSQRSEQLKLRMSTIGPDLIRLEVFRWRNGRQGCIHRVEGMHAIESDGGNRVCPWA